MIKLILFVLLVQQCLSKVVEDRKFTAEKGWHFLDKFCFDEDGGKLSVNVESGMDLGDTYFGMRNDDAKFDKLAFYEDSSSRWFSVYGSDLSCTDKINKANRAFALSNFLNRTRTFEVWGSRPRWWYIAIANCNSKMKFTYSMEFTNQGSSWDKQFSEDEQGVLQISMAFFIVLTMLLILLTVTYIICKKKKMHTKTVMGVLWALFFEWFSVLLMLSLWGKYAGDGKDIPGMENAAFAFDGIYQIIFLGAMLLLVKGWPISTNHIYGKRLWILIVVGYTCLYVALFIWYYATYNPAVVLYLYDSPPGYAIAIVRCLVYAWAVKDLIMTYRYEVEDTKKTFYLILSVFITFWFLILPIIVLTAHFLEDWSRKRIVVGVSLGLNTVTFLFVALLFRPFQGNRYFSVLDPNAKVSFALNKGQIFPL